MGGRLIAIEGIDGAGKGTQAATLLAALRAAGQRCELISFPRYRETYFGARIGEFLNGRFGGLDEVHPFLAAALFAGDRFESRTLLSEALARNDIVLLDRYVASNIAHQAAKLAGEQRAELIRQIEQLEHDVYRLPRADRVILLDLPVRVAQELISRKAARAYTDRAADLQEADAAYLESVREVYLGLAAERDGWRVVTVAPQGALRTVEEIAGDVLTAAIGEDGNRSDSPARLAEPPGVR
ncbi:MAG: thymidylate kinase [Planctomyces sp.]|nr:thymidylate kinase [Planctomyces sp.]